MQHQLAPGAHRSPGFPRKSLGMRFTCGGTHSVVFPARHPHLPNPSKRERTGTTMPCLCISYKSEAATLVAWGFSLQKPSGKRKGDRAPCGSQPGNGAQTDSHTAQTFFVRSLCTEAARSSFKEPGNASCEADVKSAAAKSPPGGAPGGGLQVCHAARARQWDPGPPPGAPRFGAPGFTRAGRHAAASGWAGACSGGLSPPPPGPLPQGTHRALGAEAPHPELRAGTGADAAPATAELPSQPQRREGAQHPAAPAPERRQPRPLRSQAAAVSRLALPERRGPASSHPRHPPSTAAVPGGSPQP